MASPSKILMGLLALLLSLLSACTTDKAPASECTSCPPLQDLPCHIGLEASAAYYYCDPCGVSWHCELSTTDARDFLYWVPSDAVCACVGADGSLDTTSDGCASSR